MSSECEFQAEERSLTHGIFSKLIWHPVANLLPVWLKPNTITVCGGCFMLLSGLFIWIAFQGMNWAFLAAAISVFLYMMGDNIDGLHARRTGQTSRLGEFLDHWLDSINFLVINLCVVFVLDFQGCILVLYLVCATSSFFATMWEQYHTGVFCGRLIGTNEGLLITIGLYLALFFFFKTPFFTYQGPLKINVAIGIAYLMIGVGTTTTLSVFFRLRKYWFEYISLILAISVISAWVLTGLVDKLLAVLLILGINIPFCGRFLLRQLSGRKSLYRNWIAILLSVIGSIVLFFKDNIFFPMELYIIYIALVMIILAIFWDLFRAVSVLGYSEKKPRKRKPIPI